MQTEATALPVVCSDGNERSTRNPDIKTKSSQEEVKNQKTSKRISHFVSNRTQLHPLVGGPYRNSMRLYALSEPVRSTNKTTVGQRVMSAKMLRVKQLQNQLTDAHYHLNELANENRLLKAMQKRQDSALRKYEGTNAELPRIINSHHEELKVLQTKHKKLRMQHKHTCDMLKEKENEIYALQSQNKHLVQLSKDKNLEERDKLQMRVSDLNFRIQQQQETIQTLNRKLNLESKSLKHQLNGEMTKHKETQKNLHEALEKLKNLEDLLDNREKRLYYSGRLPVCNKGKPMGSQSLMNLGQNGVSANPIKSGNKSRGSQIDAETGSLPKLTRTESNEGKTIPILKVDQTESTLVTETMSNLHQVRKFRLQKSYSRNGSAGLLGEMEKSEENETVRNENDGKSSNFEKLRAKRTTMNENESEDEEIKKIVDNFEITNGKGPYKLPKQLMREFGYSSSESETETRENGELDYESTLLASKSRDLHTRLISDDTAIADSQLKKSANVENSASTSDSESGPENGTKIVSIHKKDNYSLALRRSRNEEENGGLSLEDFLKLDINATDSDLEMERLRRTKSEKTEKTKFEKMEISSDPPVDRLLAGSHETSQQRLLNITKSWTELQAKIKREREISESQLQALNEESSLDSYLLEKKLNFFENDDLTKNSSISDKMKENDEKSCVKTSVDSVSSQIRINDRERLPVEENIEISHSQQNGTIRDLRVSENGPTTKSEISDCHRQSTYVKETEMTIKNCENSTNHEISEKISSDGPEKFAIEKNGTVNKGIDDDDADEDTKMANYNKQKLLAAMKAIDDNENIEFVSNKIKHRVVNNTAIRSQSTITENLYRGLPTHVRKKNDILKEIFSDVKEETKLRAGCSKLH